MEKGKTYYIMSDIHGFYTEMREALKKAGYKKTDPNAILVVCGDIFDRGSECVEVYKFLRSIPKSRRMLIRGNHELLLRDAINRGVFYQHDLSNGTVSTAMQFTGSDYFDCVYDSITVCNKFKDMGILQWIFSKEWCNYLELGNYIFVHSWVPVNILDGTDIYDCNSHTDIAFNPDWRNASEKEWEDATWGCPWLMAQKKLVPENRTIVCGHWTAAEFARNLDKKTDDYPNYNIYKGHGCIALDACTARTHFCNVLVLREEDLFTPKGK